MDAASYGRLTLLWSAVFITVSILYRPVEQLLARSIADRDARLAAGSRHLRVAGSIQLALAAAFVLAAFALRGPIEDGLFAGSETLFWIMVGTVLAYAGSYFARGVLAGRRRFGAYGGLLLLESCTRVTFALAVAVGVATGVSVVALGMAVGPAVSLAVVLAVAGRTASRGRRRESRLDEAHANRRLPEPGRRRPGSAGEEPDATVDGGTPAATVDGGSSPTTVDAHPAVSTAGAGIPSTTVDAGTPADARPSGATAPSEPELSLTRGAGYAAGVLLIMASEQAFLTAGPLLINATEAVAGAALAGFAFNALLIARAPLQLFQAVQASILPHLTHLRAAGHADPFHRSVRLTLTAVGGFATVVTLALLAVGPEVMELLFGGGFDYARGGLALMGVGMGLYLVAATLTQAALARRQAGAAAGRWLAAAAVFVGLLLVPAGDDRVLQVEVAFAGGALALCLGLYLLYRRGERGSAAAAHGR